MSWTILTGQYWDVDVVTYTISRRLPSADRDAIERGIDLLGRVSGLEFTPAANSSSAALTLLSKSEPHVHQGDPALADALGYAWRGIYPDTGIIAKAWAAFASAGWDFPHVVLHELMHTLGYSHTDEDDRTQGSGETVMSYGYASHLATDLFAYDVHALQAVYGPDRTIQGTDLAGFDGADTLTGGSGADWLIGYKGPDHLEGGAERDILRAGKGHDTLNGGDGDDTMYGGLGRDVFVLSAGDDTVMDWTSGEDRIEGQIIDVALDDQGLRVTGNEGTMLLVGIFDWGDAIA